MLLSCLAIASVAGAQTLTVNATPTAGPTCNNGTNGSATINFSGCSGPYTYTVNGGTPQVTNNASVNLTNLSAGAYTVAATTGGGGGTTTLFSDNFDNTSNWTLNTAIGAQDAEANAWVIDDFESWDGVCNSGNLVTTGDKTLHVYCTGQFCSLFGSGAIYDAGGGILSNTTTDKFASLNTNINTTGQTNIVVKFGWRCMGQTDIDYGTLRYSINGGTSWIDLATKYQNQLNWACASVTLPAACENIPNLRLAFRWRNNDDGVGTDPTFAIDDLVVTGGSGSGGCAGTVSFNLANPAPFVPTTNLTGNVDLCQGDVITLSATNANNCTPVTITGEGTYTLTCQNQAGCSGTSAPVIVTLVNDPVANFSFNQIDNYTVDFTSTGSGATTYEWSISDNVIGTGSNLSYDFASDGNYNVTLIVTNACGSDTITLPVQVIKVGINESAVFSTFDLFPNPASSQVMLQLNAIKPVNGVIKVVTPLGQIVAEEIIKFNGAFNKTFDITNLASGIYSIVITTEGNSFSRKLVVE
ncbi:MAG: T9SS type A sorting domain-containing protein [Sphingobacteriales bacterium JAD_PAG50586_3]|nr:MAG: T9SS type A sorting domain-containing protein [Sphingobacteriales bacterium JAD_PAG50586_3]